MADSPHEVCQQQRMMYELHLNAYWRVEWDRMAKRQEFKNGNRYKDQSEEFNKNPRLIRVIGNQTYDRCRHVTGELTAKPLSIEARPIDQIDDPAYAEAVVSIMKWDLERPDKCFLDRNEGMILEATSRALGVIWMDWDPKCGPYGDRLFRRIDPTRCMWDEAYEDPHEPGCSFFWESKRLDVDTIHATYKGTDWVKPDKEALNIERSSFRPGYPLMEGAAGQYARGTIQDDHKATLWLCWYKNDPGYTEKVDPNKTETLSPDQRYMICESGCGYQSPTQQDAGGEYPDTVPARAPEEAFGGCPTCGGPLTRMDRRTIPVMEQTYRNGKRLVITAPFQSAGDEKPIYDGDWPIPTARSFPGCFLTQYQEPGNPVGRCEVDLGWTNQFALDQLSTLAVQRIFEYRTHWEIPETGVEDQDGGRYAFKDDDLIMIRKNTAGWQPEVKTHNAIGLDPQFMVPYNLLMSQFMSTSPKADFGITEESSKAIPVGTVQTLEKQAEIPTEHFARRHRRALSKFYGVLWDYIRATVHKDQLMRLRIEGTDVMLSGIGGDDLPNYDFWVEDSPQFSGIDEQRSRAWDAAMQVPTELLESWGKFHEVPQSVVRSIEEARQEMEAKQMQMQQQQMGGGAGPGASPPDMGEGPPPGTDMSSLLG